MFEVTTVDAHVAGGAVRLITAGLPHVDASSLGERQQLLTERAGATLAALTREPRGHSGVVVVVPAEAGHRGRRCGVAVLSIVGTRPAVRSRAHRRNRPGDHSRRAHTSRARYRAVRHDGRQDDRDDGRRCPAIGVVPVRYTGPPTTVLRPNVPINLGRRDLRADLVWSGTELVAIVDAETAGVPLVSSRALELQRAGVAIIRHLDESIRVTHPETGSRVLNRLRSLHRACARERRGHAQRLRAHRRHRRGTRQAAAQRRPLPPVLSAMGLLAAGRRLVHQGLIGTTLWATILSIADVEGRPTVDVEIGGESWPTGDHVFRFDEADPLLVNDWERVIAFGLSLTRVRSAPIFRESPGSSRCRSTMRVVTVLARCLVVGILSVPAIGAADEPFWNSRPLGYWLNQLRVGDAAARTQAARGVGEIAAAHGGKVVAAAIPLLVPCLDSPEAPLRAAAADALGPIGTAADGAGPRLLTLFEADPDPSVRRAAGVALARVRPGSSDLISSSARVLARDQEAAVREVAAAALVEAGAGRLAWAVGRPGRARRSRSDGAGVLRGHRRPCRRSRQRDAGASGRTVERRSRRSVRSRPGSSPRPRLPTSRRSRR